MSYKNDKSLIMNIAIGFIIACFISAPIIIILSLLQWQPVDNQNQADNSVASAQPQAAAKSNDLFQYANYDKGVAFHYSSTWQLHDKTNGNKSCHNRDKEYRNLTPLKRKECFVKINNHNLLFILL